MILLRLVVIAGLAPAAGVAGCELARDGVLSGYYGPEQAGRGAASVTAGTGAVSGTGAVAGTNSSPLPSGAPTLGASGSSGQPASAEPPPMAAGPTRTSGDGTVPQNPVPMMEPPPCDLSGRWLATLHYVTDALGQLQSCHSYVYYEIQQTGSSFTITKGLHCGDDAIAEGDFAAVADFSASWAASASRVQYAGRTGTSEATSGGCQVSFQKWYTVRGATLPHYIDPSIELPSAEQPAMGASPGWEDWDMDGNPGITGVISGIVSGKVFVAPRQWTSLTGSVPDVSSGFRLPLQWDQDPNVMAYDGSPLLASTAARSADATLHFAEFARMPAVPALGDDAAICASVTKLAATLTPDAAGM